LTFSPIPRALARSLDDLYVVGGAVRNLLLGEEPAEYDLITTSSLKDIPLKTFAPSNNGKTVGVYYKGMKYDITRYEILEEDLKRRDFTINSMAVPVEKDGTLKMERIVDPCNGKEDLKRRILRTFKAQNLFQDPVRVIRGLRFVSEENFDLDHATFSTMQDAIKGISQTARERIFPPLEKFVMGKYFSKASEFAKNMNVEEYLSFPIANLDKAKRVDPSCRWSVIFYQSPMLDEFIERVFPPRRVIHQIKRITSLALEIKDGKFGWTVKIKHDEIRCLVELLNVFDISSKFVKKYEKTMLNISPAELQTMGITGKDIPRVMEKIWEMVLKSEIPNERETLWKLAKKLKSDFLDQK
jgi:tRNA nucleotidyltransferase/poly(A) polymerase